MMNNVIQSVIAIFTAIVGIAIISIIVSNKSQSVPVIQAGFNGFDTALTNALGAV